MFRPRIVVAAFTVLTLILVPAGCQPSTPGDLSRLAGWKGAAPRSPDAFNFVVVSDRTGGHVPGEWAAAVKQVNLLKPDFVICVGDLIEGYSEDPNELTAQRDEFDQIARGLEAPFFYCPGNHDVSNDVMLATYIDRYGVDGKTYYSFDYRGCHFVVLDSNTALRKPASADEQLAWLSKDLDAARAAKWVFVIYHHPLWLNPTLWPQLRALLDPKRTTVFNGHWHELSYGEDPEITTYVLAATSAEVGKRGRAFGEFRMFAHVAVDKGEPTIALLPLHEVLPAEYAVFTSKVAKMVVPGATILIPAEGGKLDFKQSNPLPEPVTVWMEWEARGWKVTPAEARLNVQPGESQTASFTLKRQAGDAPRPQAKATYTFSDLVGRPVTHTEVTRLAFYATMDIPRAEAIQVDGELKDWRRIRPLAVKAKGNIFRGEESWDGPKDSSCAIRAAHDGQRLYVAIDVNDDVIFTEDESPWRNDAIEFFWDVRPAGEQTGGHGQGTGQVILAVPADGAAIKPYWNVPNRREVKGLQVACKRRKGGYVCELSIPFDQLGAKEPFASGRQINLEIQLDDRDGEALTFMTTSGMANSYRQTMGYARCTLK